MEMESVDSATHFSCIETQAYKMSAGQITNDEATNALLSSAARLHVFIFKLCLSETVYVPLIY